MNEQSHSLAHPLNANKAGRFQLYVFFFNQAWVGVVGRACGGSGSNWGDVMMSPQILLGREPAECDPRGTSFRSTPAGKTDNIWQGRFRGKSH